MATIRISTASDGNQGDNQSYGPTFSPDGTKLLFYSSASNLVPGDTNGKADIFIKNLLTGAISRVSTGSSAGQGDGQSYAPAFSPDGTKIAFYSFSSNFVPDDTNGNADIFIKDLSTGYVTRISTDSSGTQGNNVSVGSIDPAFSPDGTKLAFASYASNLVPNDTNGQADIFVKNLITAAIVRVSTDSNNNQINITSGRPVFSPDGTKVAFYGLPLNITAGDPNKHSDLYIKDLNTGQVTAVSTDGSGTLGGSNFSDRPAFSPDGTKVAYYSYDPVPNGTSGIRNLMLLDQTTGNAICISTDSSGIVGNGDSYAPAFSPDGTKLTFYSRSSNLVAGDTNDAYDIFVKDLSSGAIIRISNDSSGRQGNGWSFDPTFAPDGTKVAYTSYASNLVTGDTNTASDVFITDVNLGTNNTNYTPKIISNGGLDIVNILVLENSNFVTVVKALDADANQTLTYSISGGLDASLFNINQQSGELSFKLAPNFEQPADAGGNNVYDVVVKVSDGSLYDTQRIAIAVLDVVNETVTGTSAADALTGAVGNDLIDGMGGADTMSGGLGDDTYIVDNAGDKVIELYGQGNDTVKSSVSYALYGPMYPSGTFVETLQLTGTSAISGTGNGLANTLIGNSANNILDGMSGADTMSGGLGNDTYIVDNVGDKVIELYGQGNDTVKSSVSYALSGPMYPSGTFIETLQLTGTSAINGTGNGLNNVLTGNSANNILDGGAGNDTLTGGAGADTFLFSFPASASNADTITDFAAGIDHIALARGAFHNLPVGAVSWAMFHLGTVATTANDHLIYDSSSGHLWYDADGTGSAAQNLIATLLPGTHLAATDVFVI